MSGAIQDNYVRGMAAQFYGIKDNTDSINRLVHFTDMGKNQKVGGKDVKVVCPASQKFDYLGVYSSRITQPMQPLPSDSVLMGGSSSFSDLLLTAATLPRVRNLVFRFTVKNTDSTNALTPLPCNYFVNRIEFRSSQNDKILQTYWPEQFYYDYSFYSQEQLNVLLPAAGFSTSWGAGSSIATSATKCFYLVVPNSWISRTLMSNVGSNLNDVIRFYWNINGVLASGTVTDGKLALQNVEALMECDMLSGQDASRNLGLNTQIIQKWNILDMVTITNTVSLQAGVNYKQTLQQLIGKFSSLVIIIRASMASASSAILTTTDLKDDGVLDIVTPNNTPLYSNGTMVRGDDLKYFIYPQEFNANLEQYQSVYFINFGSPRRYNQGCNDGAFCFNGDQYMLSITPGTGFSTATYTLTILGVLQQSISILNNQMSTSYD